MNKNKQTNKSHVYQPFIKSTNASAYLSLLWEVLDIRGFMKVKL